VNESIATKESRDSMAAWYKDVAIAPRAVTFRLVRARYLLAIAERLHFCNELRQQA
jgi:hypothetical protein